MKVDKIGKIKFPNQIFHNKKPMLEKHIKNTKNEKWKMKQRTNCKTRKKKKHISKPNIPIARYLKNANNENRWKQTSSNQIFHEEILMIEHMLNRKVKQKKLYIKRRTKKKNNVKEMKMKRNK